VKEYDFVIIGGGAAGFTCAVKLSELSGGDARIALVNSGPIGGTCVNVGCVPSKALIEAGKLAFESSRTRIPGIRSRTEISFEEVMS
jgi:mercuric reductase